MGRERPRLVAQLAGDHRRRGARGRRRPARVRAEPVGRVVGVALLHVDVLGRDPELLGDDLGERRLVALALRLHAELEHRLAGRVHAQLGRVEHAQPDDVELLAVAGADDLGERREPDADQLALLARLLLLPAQLLVAELLEREVQRALVVAGVVDEAGGRGVRELIRLDEVRTPELGRVEPELVRGGLDEPLDQVRRLGDAERAAVGDAARRLVRVRAVGHDVRRRDVVRAGDDVEEAGLELRRLRVGEEGAVVGEQLDLQAHHAVALDRELAAHVVVAGEAGRDQVPRAVLDPLHRPADQQRGRRRDDVARVDRHLVAEAAADVGRDDPDLVLGQPGDDGEQRPVRMWSLRRHVDRRLAGRRVDVRDAAAALERRRMAARVEGVERDDAVGLGERALGGVRVARLPVVDVVRGLALLVVTDQGRVLGERLLRARDRRERLVVDLDQLERVLRDVRRLGDHGRDLLALEAHLVRGEHSLRVAGERRHPGEVVRRERLAGDHRHDAGQLRRPRDVDRADARVRERAAQELHVEHPRQDDVVDVRPLAANEAGVLLALDRVAEPANLRRSHRYTSSALSLAAAYCTALTMFW